MNPRILGSVVSLLTVLTMMAGATYALFSSQATNVGNTFAAGTLELLINPEASPSPAPVFSVTGMAPGASQSGVFKLKNNGTVDASSVQVALIDTSATIGDYVDILGELTLQFFTDVNGDGIFDVGDDTLIPGSGHLSDPSWANWTIPGVTLPAGTTYHLGAILTLDADASNLVQGDIATFSITFKANQ